MNDPDSEISMDTDPGPLQLRMCTSCACLPVKAGPCPMCGSLCILYMKRIPIRLSPRFHKKAVELFDNVVDSMLEDLLCTPQEGNSLLTLLFLSILLDDRVELENREGHLPVLETNITDMDVFVRHLANLCFPPLQKA